MKSPLPVLLQGLLISNDIHTFILSKISNALRLPAKVTRTTCLRDIKLKLLVPFSAPFQKGRNFIFLLKQIQRFFLNFTWFHPCVQVLHIHVFCYCAMHRRTYHRLGKQKRPRHLSQLRSLPRTENCPRHHSSHRSGNKVRSNVYSTDGRNEIFHCIHTI